MIITGATIFSSLCGLCPQKPSRIIKFGFITDVHWGDYEPYYGPNMTMVYQDADDKLNEFISDMNEWGADFVVQGGDFADGSQSGVESRLDYICNLYNNLNMPHYHCRGNHENTEMNPSQWATYFDLSYSYYSHNVNGAHIVVLDGNADNGAYGSAQRSWLESDLLANKNSNAYPVFVFGHYSIRTAGHSDDSLVRSILEDDGLTVACFNGHNHDAADGNVTINGIKYIAIYGNGTWFFSDGDKNSYAKCSYNVETGEFSLVGVGQQVSYN